MGSPRCSIAAQRVLLSWADDVGAPMSRRLALFLLILGFALTAGAAQADPTFVFLRSFKDPNNFESRFRSCINQFNAAGGLAGNVLNQLDGAEVVVSYQQGGAGVVNPAPNGNSTGALIYMSWDPNLSGRYIDKAPKVPCAALLHELEHAARYFMGRECTGTFADNPAAYKHDEKLGARAENWWLHRLGLKQRTTYELGSTNLRLDRWTRWPPLSAYPVPPAPRCDRCAGPNAAAAAACRRCTRFNQPGCFDFRGGIYSGGDHRRVANGSLKIIIGEAGYCQGREPCEFKECVTCPHLDTAFPAGTSVSAIATPGKDSRFARWGPGACKGQGPTCSFEAEKDSCISAQFLLTNPTAPPQSLRDVPCPEDP